MYNWSHAVKLGETNQVIVAQNEADISNILKNLGPGQKVKVLGSGMSYLGIGAVRPPPTQTKSKSSDILLDLSVISGLLDIGPDYATFGGSTILQDISNILKARGLQLGACPGVLVTQTVAGAIATGTHGQGLANGGLCDIVREIRVVHADGSIGKYSRNEPKYSSSEYNPFDAFRLHLGCLGILTRVTLDCVPHKIYRLVKSVTEFNDLQENFLSWNQTAEHCKAWWFPETDHVQVWRTCEANRE
jgi:FAD/FMN-containing dehydrogenase